MNPEQAGAQPAPPQPAAPRKSRAGLVGLIVAVLVLGGGGAAAYYQFLYLPGTPKAVLTEYFALQEKGDADGTYRFLSEKSRKVFSPDRWKMAYQWQGSAQALYTFQYTLGEPKPAGDRCRIPVTVNVTAKPSARGTPGLNQPIPARTQDVLLVREKTGWKVGVIEQSMEQAIESMRKSGASEKQIQEAVKSMERMIEQSAAETPR